MTFLLFNTYSQTVDSTISIKKRKFYQNGQKLKPTELNRILSTNTFSAHEYQLYKKNSSISLPFLLAGSILVCAGSVVSFSSALKETNDINSGQLPGKYPSGLGLILVGGACVIVSLPFAIPAKKHLNKSIDLYNSSIKDVGSARIEFNLNVNSRGVGVIMRF